MFKLAFAATIAVAGANPLKKMYKPPVKSCPKGFTLEDKQCVSRQFAEEQLACTAGYLVGEWCELFSPATKACPLGWTLSGKSCVYTSSIPAEAICYNGYSLEGDVCVSWDQIELVPTCRLGTLSGNSCLVQEADAPQYQCDAVFNKGECYRLETYACPTKKSTYAHGRYLGKKKRRASWYYPTTTLKYRQPVYTKKAPVVQAKKAPEPTLCTRKVDVELTARCAAGFTLLGDVCSRTISHPPDYICPVGGDSKGCYEKTETSPAYRCPSGYIESKNGCLKTETQDAVYECAEGVLDGTECVLRSAPESYCAEGVASGKGQCLIVSFAEPTVTASKKGYW